MKLTNEVKERIDSMSYYGLLDKWRFAPIGDTMFQGESGKYFAEIMAKKRSEVGSAHHVATSKLLGWAEEE